LEGFIKWKCKGGGEIGQPITPQKEIENWKIRIQISEGFTKRFVKKVHLTPFLKRGKAISNGGNLAVNTLNY
jgi:hypothetical protein